MLREKFEFLNRNKYETRKIKNIETCILWGCNIALWGYATMVEISYIYSEKKQIYTTSAHIWVMLIIATLLFLTLEISITRYIVLKNNLVSSEAYCLWKETVRVIIAYVVTIAIIGVFIGYAIL